MKEIQLTKGQFAIIDDDDYEMISKNKWAASHGEVGKIYAVKTLNMGGGRRKRIYMHRVIMNAPLDKQVDHKNGNKLDNRRSNLRLCSKNENMRNRQRYSRNTSGSKGVRWYGYNGHSHWVARIVVNRKNIHLGYFDRKIDAVGAYNTAAIRYHKEFAVLSSL